MPGGLQAFLVVTVLCSKKPGDIGGRGGSEALLQRLLLLLSVRPSVGKMCVGSI